MNTRPSETSDDPLAAAQRDLRMAGRELKWLQIEHEHNLETLQRVRRQRTRLREQVEAMSDALAASLSELYWATRPAPSGPSRLLGRTRPSDPEAELVRQVEDCDRFDGGWYLRQHPRAVGSGISPALHYVRHGNARSLDPGPRFSTSAYLRRHPQAADEGVPALLHAVRHGNLDETTTDGAAPSAADDLHL